MAGNSSDSRSVTSKVAAILLTLADGSTHSLTEITGLTGLPISTLHRLLAELVAFGLLERTDEIQYRVGAPLRAIGATTGCALSVPEQAQRAMEDVSYATQRDVRLGTLHGTEVQYVIKPAGHQPVSSCSPTKVVPAYASAMGKSILAYSSPSVVESMIEDAVAQCASFTVNSGQRLRKSLASIRLARLAVSRGNAPNGKCAVAVPVFDGGSNVVAALEVDVCDLSNDLRLVQSVLTVAARSLSRELVKTHNANHPYPLVSSWPQEYSYREAVCEENRVSCLTRSVERVPAEG